MLPYTILIIDDTADHRDVLGRLLRSVGYQVVEAATGEEALRAACAVRPDLILTAVSLPGQPAWNTTRRLHAEPDLATTPILGATLYNTLLPWSWIRTLGCVDLVNKPFDLDDLLRRIALLLPSAPPALLIA